MAFDQTKDLLKFLKPFPPEIQETALWLRKFVWDLYPDTNELIYDNYNAVAFGWSPTDKVGHTFCLIAVGRSSQNVHFGFYWGAELNDTRKLLLGNGNQYRYVLVKSREDFPLPYIKKLLKEAYNNSPKQLIQGQTITKSISAAKKTPAKKKKA